LSALAAVVLVVPAAARAQQPVAPAAVDSTHLDSATVAALRAGARPISLDDAVRLAEQRSPVIRIAQNAVTRATGQRAQARSALFPQLNGSASYTRTLASQFQNAFSAPKADTTRPTGPPGPCSQYIFGADSSTLTRVAGLENYARCTTAGNGTSGLGIDFSKVGFGSLNTYNLGLTGSQNLFTGGRILGQIEAASATRRSAAVELTAQRAQLRLDVASAYYDASLADRLVAIAQATLAQARGVLQQTQLQQKVGNVSEFDLLRAQVSVNTQIPVVL
jgi:outer membrane protein TolC